MKLSALSHRALPIVFLLSLTPVLCAEDWPQLRGPSQNGITQAAELAGAVTVEFEVVWRKPLGSGYSAVSVLGQTAVTAATLDQRDRIVALDPLSGEQLWQFDLAPVFEGRNGSDDGTSSTPTLGRGKVFALHPSGRLVSLSLDSGTLLWQRHLIEDFGSPLPIYGYSTAPLLVGDTLYVQAGGSEGRLLVALSADTGELKWSAGEDPVPLEHQNPMAFDGPGGRQIITVSPSALSGYRSSDGEQLWTLELEGRGHAGDITIVDDHRFLLHRHNEDSRLIAIEQSAAGLSARVVWSTTSLDHTYAIPIVHDGHVYGFDQRFLVCLDLETGELLWKSRPPGGRQLSLLGDQLMVVNDVGELVSVAADPEGYRETGRTRLFRRRMVMTPITHSGGLLLIRNLTEIVALRARATRSRDERPSRLTRRATDREIPPFLGRLLEEVGQAELEQALRDRYPTFPVVEDGRVHFLWLGDDPDVAVLGDMTHFYDEVPLERLAETGVHWASFDAPAGERFEYLFKLFEEERLDPNNPKTLASVEGERSVVELPGYQEWQPDECAGCARGSLRQVEVESQTPGRKYSMTVYTPPGYEQESRLPLLILAEGGGARTLGDIVPVIDSLIGRREIRPIVVALLELPEAAWYSGSRQRMAEIFDQDLIPFLEREFRLSSERTERALVSQRWAVDNSLLWTAERGTIGLYATQSPSIGERTLERELEPLLPNARPMTVRIDLGRFDQKNPDYGLNTELQSRELAELLRRHGHQARIVETPGGANWTRWRKELANILRDFFPIE